MSDDSHGLDQDRSWRDIRQDVSSRAMSARGRQRRFMGWVHGSLLVALLGAAAWGAYTVVHTWETDRAAVAVAVKSEPIRHVVLRNPGGVLDEAWVREQLALPRNATLMGLDLEALRARLLVHGQVRHVTLTREFPDRLAVALEERTPVVRAQGVDAAGKSAQLLVARDGVVYEGHGYDTKLVSSLPWLAGVTLQRAGGRFVPVPGMESVNALLTAAQLQAPHLYRKWVTVSIERLASHDELIVNSQDAAEIVFTRRNEFLRQLAQLDYIIDTTRAALPEPALASVNLAHGGEVPVRLAAGTPDQLARQAVDAPFLPNLPSTSQRRNQRDL